MEFDRLLKTSGSKILSFPLIPYLLLQLYGEFADVYDLYECKLAIVSCAGHEDDALVDSLWQNIITKGVRTYVCARMLCILCLCVCTCTCVLCLFMYVYWVCACVCPRLHVL